MVRIDVVHSDVTEIDCDLLVLKFANGLHGADKSIANIIGFEGWIGNGNSLFLQGKNIRARSVLFIGVGELFEFRYESIRSFGRNLLSTASSSKLPVRSIALTLHGPGYGLDEREAFLSLVGGLTDGLKADAYPIDLANIQVVEINLRRAKRLQEILDDIITDSAINNPSSLPSQDKAVNDDRTYSSLSSYGAESEKKPKIFVAMPFAKEHSDVWEISIQEACYNAGIGCERIDEQSFTGDITAEILSRVRECRAVVAVLDGANPNVFLEIGYAWGIGKSTILIAKEGTILPFDVRSQKCIIYTSIRDLRDKMQREIMDLRNKRLI